MKFLRKILGLGPKQLINFKRATTTATIEKFNTTPGLTLNKKKIYPTLVSEKTKNYNLENEIVAGFHQREGNYASIVVTNVVLDVNDLKYGKPSVYHMGTTGEYEASYAAFQERAKMNLDDLEIPFRVWNYAENKLDFKILSCKVSLVSSEKILSKKHMEEAHKELDATELFVSIPRKGLIFVCSKNITQQQYNDFLDLHASVVLQENKDLELLCEDIFILRNGEIQSVLAINPLSEKLRETL